MQFGKDKHDLTIYQEYSIHINQNQMVIQLFSPLMKQFSVAICMASTIVEGKEIRALSPFCTLSETKKRVTI